MGYLVAQTRRVARSVHCLANLGEKPVDLDTFSPRYRLGAVGDSTPSRRSHVRGLRRLSPFDKGLGNTRSTYRNDSTPVVRAGERSPGVEPDRRRGARWPPLVA
jgi:hypothetical protein